MLDLNIIQIFLFLAKVKNLNLAAKRMGVTPPALSHRIKSLEELVGHSLFLRKHTGMELNKKGRELFEVCENLTKDAKRIENWVLNQRGYVGGEVTLTVISGLTAYLLPDFLGPFIKKYPEIKIVIDTVMSSANVEERLLQGESDIGIIAGPCLKPSLKLKKILHNNNLLLVYSPEYSPEKKLTKKDLSHVNFIWHGHASDRSRIALMKVLKVKINENDSLTLPDMEATKQMALKGLGVTSIANIYVHNEIRENKLIAIPGVCLNRPLNLVSRNEKYAPPALKIFKEEFVGYCESVNDVLL
ncbi:MAG: LysR family transcriptional regulator [bacterium]|nr:LysR family transcriptional regulator [bacterium]